MAYTQQHFRAALLAWRNGPQREANFMELWQSGNMAYLTLTVDEVEATVKEVFSSPLIPAEYVSVWDGGTLITTECKFNIDTNEIEDLQTTDEGLEGTEVCDGEFVRLPNGIVIRCRDGEVIV